MPLAWTTQSSPIVSGNSCEAADRRYALRLSRTRNRCCQLIPESQRMAIGTDDCKPNPTPSGLPTAEQLRLRNAQNTSARSNTQSATARWRQSGNHRPAEPARLSGSNYSGSARSCERTASGCHACGPIDQPEERRPTPGRRTAAAGLHQEIKKSTTSEKTTVGTANRPKSPPKATEPPFVFPNPFRVILLAASHGY